MCVIATKYIDGIGWVAGKNRDRSYKPTVHIKQSNRLGIERCLLWDSKTKWTEGVNEYGVAILNTTMKVSKDEKEGDKATSKQQLDVFYSPGGKAIRTALFEKTPKAALDKLIELEMEGFCLVLSKDEAYLLESPVYVDTPDIEYQHKWIKLDKTKSYVRTNHGILFPEAGYPIESDDETMVKSRESSETRYKIVHDGLKEVKDPIDILKVLSKQPNKNTQMNPLRSSKTHGTHIMVTTGQLLVIPSQNTLHYRPIWCEMEFDFKKLDSPKTKTWFEVISSRHMLSDFKNESMKSFKEFFYG